MRTLILTLAVVVTLLMIPAINAGSAVSPGPAFGPVVLVAHTAEMAQMPQISVDIHDSSSPSWNPMGIAIGVIGLLLVGVLVKMANRCGSR